MQNTTHQQCVLDLLQQQGLLRASDLDAIGVPRVVLSRLTASGQLERVGRGLYRLPGSTAARHPSTKAWPLLLSKCRRLFSAYSPHCNFTS